MTSRRNFLGGMGATSAAVSAATVSRVALAALPEPAIQTTPATMPPLLPKSGRQYNPVVTINGWTLPWPMNNDVKEFHLVAEPARFKSEGGQSMPLLKQPRTDIEVKIRKPSGPMQH